MPGKNIAPFLGQPLIDWSVKAAKDARSVTRIVTSTDDGKIAKCAKSAGAEAPFLRPPELAKDGTRDHPVFVHALNWLKEKENYVPDFVIHLRPTSPLRPPGLIDEGVMAIQKDNRADSLRAVCEPQNNPFKMWRLRTDTPYMEQLCQIDIDEPYNQPRQALPDAYWQIGVLDVIRTKTILEKNSMTGERILPLIVDPRLAVDIDDALSFQVAEKRCREYGMGEVA